MPRTGKRVTLQRGIYRDSGGIEVRVQRHGRTFSERYPLNTALPDLQRALRGLKARAETELPAIPKNTLAADVVEFLKLITEQVGYKNVRASMNAWIARIGHKHRHTITRKDVLEARVAWQQAGLSPKTINNRCSSLRRLYKLLDGPGTRTPYDDVGQLYVPKTPIQRVPEETILAVDLELQRREAGTYTLKTAKTRARFRVLVSTGRRPSEIMRAEPGDVDLERRVWIVRDGKGGFSPGLYLNDDMLSAWQLFVQADAWGYFRVGSFGRVIHRAGWPKGVRLYNARHSTWITASERGIDLADIAAGAGHKDIRMTRKAYVPVLNSRMQRMGEALEGRFQGWRLVPGSGSDQKVTNMRGKKHAK